MRNVCPLEERKRLLQLSKGASLEESGGTRKREDLPSCLILLKTRSRHATPCPFRFSATGCKLEDDPVGLLHAAFDIRVKTDGNKTTVPLPDTPIGSTHTLIRQSST